MQDIHMIGAGQIFTGGGQGVVDRRLRQTHLQNQALKCPRCDSLNTKFCYYNNYNLSQPRHFCKSCRRYWTKGGVLRNVPVGGGCRKSSKRFSSKSSKPSDQEFQQPMSNNSHSGSDCSSLTGTKNVAVVANAVTEDLATAPSTSVTTPPSADAVSSSFDPAFGFGDTKFIFPQIRNTNFCSELIDGSGGGGFIEIGNFSTMMTSSSNNDPTTQNCMNISYDAVSPFRKNLQEENEPYEQWQLNSEEGNAAGDYINPTVQMDQSSNLQQMFELASTVDHGYWSQQQWSNADNPHQQHLYLP
ncbi:unnamed protein product [Rhodiola kirilowii]